MRLALGEIFSSAKNLSRRCRSTFGKEAALAELPAVCCGNASEGTRSSMSGVSVVADCTSDVTGASKILLSWPAHPGWKHLWPWPAAYRFPAADSVTLQW